MKKKEKTIAFDKRSDVLFIKMCEKAEDLQKLKREDEERYKQQSDDNAYYVLPSGEIYYADVRVLEKKFGKKEKIWWIPSQRQMQDIIAKGIERYVDVMEKMTLEEKRKFVFSTLMDAISGWAKKHEEFYTFDQLWLSYIMLYKFNKIWNGEEWVKS